MSEDRAATGAENGGPTLPSRKRKGQGGPHDEETTMTYRIWLAAIALTALSISRLKFLLIRSKFL
jgi:hypothetical protein